jgi:hypothetical protein
MLLYLFLKIRIFADITPCIPFKHNRLSEEHVASVFRVKQYAKQESSTKKIASFVTCSSDTSVDNRGTYCFQIYNPEEGGDTFRKLSEGCKI